ncbi:MAG: hypothetical protein ACO32I_01140 [Candidatus Limnocylindrus sp.]
MSEIHKLMKEWRRCCGQQGAGKRRRREDEVEDGMWEVAAVLGVEYYGPHPWGAFYVALERELLEAEAEAEADREALRRARAPLKRFRMGRKRNGGRKPRRPY